MDKHGYFVLNPVKELPDGTVCKVFPYHISLEGLETRILCRDEEDCDAAVKIIAVCCLRKNVILVIYAVVSNHLHSVVLAASQKDADGCANEIKRMLAMYQREKYGKESVMKDIDAKAIFITDTSYVGNAMAYDVRNALDNGATRVQDYKWTGVNGMFCGGQHKAVTRVCDLSRRQKRHIMHTKEDLSRVPWMLNSSNELEPATICDWSYLEGAFKHDQAYFLRLIGDVNLAEMNETLVVAPRVKRRDQTFLASINEKSRLWFGSDVEDLTMDKKARMIEYARHTFKTDPAQIARTFEIGRDEVYLILGRKMPSK